MDKFINEPIPMTLLPLRSSSCQDIAKLRSTLCFSPRTTSLPRLSSIASPLPPLPESVYALSSSMEKMELLPATAYVPPKTTKKLPSRSISNNSRNPNNTSSISDDSSNFVNIDPRSVTVDAPRCTSSCLSPPSHPSLPLKIGDCRFSILPPDEEEVEGLVLVTVQPPTPGTAPSSVSASTPKEVKYRPRLEVKKHGKREIAALKANNRQSMLLASKVSIYAASRRRKTIWRRPKIIKHNSFNLHGPGHRKSHTSDPTCIDSRKSISHLTQRRGEDTSPPPAVPKRSFEQMYLQILEERWACYRQLDTTRKEDEKGEAEEYLAAHPVPSPSPPTVFEPTSPPAETSSARTEARRQARVARVAKQLPTIPENDKLRQNVTSWAAGPTTAKKRLTISSPHLCPGPRSSREQCQQDEKNLRDTWREWLKNDQKERGKKKKLTKKKVDSSTEDELREMREYGDAGLTVAFRRAGGDREQHEEAEKQKNSCWVCRFFKII